MNKIKASIVYGIIILLCIAAFAGYFISGGRSGTPVGKQEQNGNTQTAENNIGTNSHIGKSEDELQKHVQEVMRKSAAAPEPNPVIGIGRGDDYEEATRTAVENAGGLEGIIKKGDVVLIKPNLCTLDTPGSAKITDYRVVQEIADMAKELGASKIIIAEGPISSNAFADYMKKANGYDKISGVELIDLNGLLEEDCYELKPEKSLTGKAIYIPKIYMDADVVIGAAKLKTHNVPEAVVSLSLKNSIGVPSGKVYGKMGYKGGLHNLGLKKVIIDLNRIRKPDLVVIDGIIGGEGSGPLNNKPVNSEIIFAGRDPVAADTAALIFMGFKVGDVPHVKMAGEEGLGITDINEIRIVGADLDSIKMDFKSSVIFD